MAPGAIWLARATPIIGFVISWRLRPQVTRTLELPRPEGLLTVENLSFAVPGSTSKPILRGVSFRVEPGEVLGVIGPSGAGKSTLVRQIVGVMSPSAGAVRLDGADVSTWPKESLGRYVGYLPQDIELFADTVAANISRFQQGEDAEIILMPRRWPACTR